MAVDRKMLMQSATRSELADLAANCAMLSLTISQLCDQLKQNEQVEWLEKEFMGLFKKFDQQFDELTGWTADEG